MFRRLFRIFSKYDREVGSASRPHPACACATSRSLHRSYSGWRRTGSMAGGNGGGFSGTPSVNARRRIHRSSGSGSNVEHVHHTAGESSDDGAGASAAARRAAYIESTMEEGDSTAADSAVTLRGGWRARHSASKGEGSGISFRCMRE